MNLSHLLEKIVNFRNYVLFAVALMCLKMCCDKEIVPV